VTVTELKAQASIQALQAALDRQSDQLADFKSALRVAAKTEVQDVTK
jgi:hypothetical protein